MAFLEVTFDDLQYRMLFEGQLKIIPVRRPESKPLDMDQLNKTGKSRQNNFFEILIEICKNVVFVKNIYSLFMYYYLQHFLHKWED